MSHIIVCGRDEKETTFLGYDNLVSSFGIFSPKAISISREEKLSTISHKGFVLIIREVRWTLKSL
jgi:hypothetical protein